MSVARQPDIRPYRDKRPQIASSAYIDPASVLIGDVVIGEDSSVWPLCVIRGDVNYIRIGARTNIQDASILNIGAGADADVVDVTADNAERPNAGVFPNDHVADEDRCGINVSGGGDLRALVAVGADVRLAGNAHK